MSRRFTVQALGQALASAWRRLFRPPLVLLPVALPSDEAAWQATLQGDLPRYLDGQLPVTAAVATACDQLARRHAQAQRPDLVIEPARLALRFYESHADDAHRRRTSLLQSELAEAHYSLGQLDDALGVARRSAAIAQVLGDHAAQIRPLMTAAAVLLRRQRYPEAEECYQAALTAAEAAGDDIATGLVLQKYGLLQRRQNQFDAALRSQKRAVELFDAPLASLPYDLAEVQRHKMVVADQLATTYAQNDQLVPAETWYGHSRELAIALDDTHHLAVVGHNLGVLYQRRAERMDDAATRQALLLQAIDLVEQSLAMKLELQKKVSVEASYFQLGTLYWKLGDYDQARRHLEEATAISESLNLPQVYKNYSLLAHLAREQQDTTQASYWQSKCDAKVRELKRRKLS